MGKEAISKIREALGEESPKVETFLKAIESDYSKFDVELDDLRETVKHVNTESKQRKLKIRELEGELEDANEKVETAKGEDKSEELEALKTKLKSYDDAEAEKVKSKAKGFIDKYEALKVHADWDKAKDKFKIADPVKDDKGGKLDWDSMDINEVAKNADKLSEYQGIGLLGEANPKSEERNQARNIKGEADNIYAGKFND